MIDGGVTNLGAEHPRPKVTIFVNIYAVLMALVYWALGILLVILSLSQPVQLSTPAFLHLVRVGMIALCAVLGAAFVVMPFLPRRRWAWIYGIVLLAVGSTSICI